MASEPIERLAFAECLPHLAETARLFLGTHGHNNSVFMTPLPSRDPTPHFKYYPSCCRDLSRGEDDSVREEAREGTFTVPNSAAGPLHLSRALEQRWVTALAEVRARAVHTEVITPGVQSNAYTWAHAIIYAYLSADTGSGSTPPFSFHAALSELQDNFKDLIDPMVGRHLPYSSMIKQALLQVGAQRCCLALLLSVAVDDCLVSGPCRTRLSSAFSSTAPRTPATCCRGCFHF